MKIKIEKIYLRILFIFFLVCWSNSSIWGQKFSKESNLQTETEAKKLSGQWSGDSYRRSVALYLNAAENWLKLGEFEQTSVCLREAARLHLILADYESAANQLKKAFEIDTKNNLLNEKIQTLSLLSTVLLRAGKVKDSANYYRQAIEMSSQTASPQVIAAAFFSAGQYNYSYGNTEKTINLLQTSLSNAEKTNEKTLTAHILMYLGFAFVRQGNPILGLQKVKDSLLMWQETEDRRGQAIASVALGFVYSIMNEKQTALHYYQKANTIFPEDMDWLEKAKLYNGMATIYEEYGEFILAETFRIRALELYEKSQYPYGKLATLPSLAKLKYLNGDKISGKKLYDEALILANYLNDSFHLAIIKEDLGNLDLEDGNYDNAIEHYQKALIVYKTLNLALPRVENSLGKVFAKKGDFIFARNYFNSALKTNRQIRDVSPMAENLFNLAKLNAVEGNVKSSLEQIIESLAITDFLYNEVGNNKLRTSYISNVFDRNELFINLLIKMHNQTPNANYAIQALQAAEKSRARLMLENLSLSEANFTKDADVETVKREKEIRVLLNAKADKLTDLLSSDAAKTETDKLDNEINELENKLEEVKANLKQSSPIYSAIKNPAPFDVAEFQRNVLDENSLLLEFSFGKEESYLWLVGQTEINSYVLPPREQIESHVERLRESLAAREMKQGESVENHQARINEAEKVYRYESQQLSDELFGQIADRLSNKRLIIVPDGKLHYFPIAALPRPKSTDNLPILLTNETVYEPSAATLALLMRNGKKISAAPKNLLVFSDPIFSNRDARIAAVAENETQPASDSFQTETFRFAESLTSLVRLNASQDEADAIVGIVGESASTALSGAAATRERALDASVSDYKIIHFATHGLIKEDRPELSGIVLSQVDQNGQTRNGVVRLQDIYAMNLSADAVILSACNTGIGKEVKGEGLLSLNNAFLQAGAKSVVSSLWKVDDYAAQELMKNFYQELTSGTATTSEALRRAQIKMQRNPRYQSPFYWAAFKLEGDFQIAPKLSGNFDYRIYTLLIFPLLLLGIYIYRRKAKLLNGKIVDNG